MKKRKILALFPLVGLLLSGCSLDDVKDFFRTNIVDPVKNLINGGEKEEEKKDDQKPSEDEGKDQEEQGGQEGEGEGGHGGEGGEGQGGEGEGGETEVITHQDPFVMSIEEPSVTRNFDERFDEMADDFTGETLNGETEAAIAPSTLRVLVDSENSHKPNSPDASIYKIGTGVHDIDKFDGIGFKMRMVGNQQLKLSNLVLGLRGGDGYQVYPVKLSEALDPDGDELPALSDEFKDFVISPQLSIEDANTLYKNLDGTDSELKVLEEILGIHLYMLDEECSAILEIQEVYLVKAGEKTVMDNFNRTAVNKADDTCWWRDSTGFIVRKGINVKDGAYKAPNASKEYANLVVTVAGDTTGASITVNNVKVAWGALRDSENNPVSAAVNGGFYSFVINAENSSLGALTGGFTLSSTTDLHLAGAFYTDLEVPAPIVDYPTYDAASFFMFDNFKRTQSGFNGDYDAAIANEQTLAAGLSYQLSYNNGDKVSVNGEALVFDATELGATDYINYKACNDNLVGNYDYMIMALKAEDGATLNEFRFNIGSGVTYINQMYSAEGLKVAELNQADYPYIREGYTWLVIDLAASGMSRGAEPFIDYYYSGEGKLLVDFVGFANAERDEYVDTKVIEKTYEDGQGYEWAGYFYSAPTNRYAKMEITTTGTIDSIRFEGLVVKYFHDGEVKDADGKTITGEEGSGTYIIDLVASGLKNEGEGQDFHVHGDGEHGAVEMAIYTMELKAKTQDVAYVDATYEDAQGYAYAGYVWSPAESRYMKLVAETEGKIDSIRFEGLATKWFHDGEIVDANGETITGEEGSGTYIIDLVASGLKNEGEGQGIHVHGDGSNGAINVKIYSVDPLPDFTDVEFIHENAVEIENYAYVGGADNFGATYLVLTLSSEDDGVDLRSLRIQSGDTTAWAKDGALIDAEGNEIDKDTAVTSTPVTLVIDMAASNLVGSAVHVHLGGFDGSLGTISVTAKLQYKTNSYGHLLNSVDR